MAVPGYQEFMLPVLRIMGDGRLCSNRDLVNCISTSLSPEDLNETIPSGQTKVDNRVNWALTYLKKAGLLESPKRGQYIITDRGRSVLKTNPHEINHKFLRQFPEYMEFVRISNPTTQNTSDPMPETEGTETPEETLISSYFALRDALGSMPFLVEIPERPMFLRDLCSEFQMVLQRFP